MSVEVERALHKPTASLSAFDLYLRALPRFRTSLQDNEQALDLLAKAIELDPSYAAAHAMSARCYQFQWLFGWRLPGDPQFAQGVHHCHQAASLGRSDSEALWMAGLALVHLAGEHRLLPGVDRTISQPQSELGQRLDRQLLHPQLPRQHSDTAIDHFQKRAAAEPAGRVAAPALERDWPGLIWEAAGTRKRPTRQSQTLRMSARPICPGLRVEQW